MNNREKEELLLTFYAVNYKRNQKDREQKASE